MRYCTRISRRLLSASRTAAACQPTTATMTATRNEMCWGGTTRGIRASSHTTTTDQARAAKPTRKSSPSIRSCSWVMPASLLAGGRRESSGRREFRHDAIGELAHRALDLGPGQHRTLIEPADDLREPELVAGRLKPIDDL